jgi:hypothetical protein
MDFKIYYLVSTISYSSEIQSYDIFSIFNRFLMNLWDK